jgi:hypothetical protein
MRAAGKSSIHRRKMQSSLVLTCARICSTDSKFRSYYILTRPNVDCLHSAVANRPRKPSPVGQPLLRLGPSGLGQKLPFFTLFAVVGSNALPPVTHTQGLLAWTGNFKCSGGALASKRAPRGPTHPLLLGPTGAATAKSSLVAASHSALCATTLSRPGRHAKAGIEHRKLQRSGLTSCVRPSRSSAANGDSLRTTMPLEASPGAGSATESGSITSSIGAAETRDALDHRRWRHQIGRLACRSVCDPAARLQVL